jgi:hypothetical protein
MNGEVSIRKFQKFETARPTHKYLEQCKHPSFDMIIRKCFI